MACEPLIAPVVSSRGVRLSACACGRNGALRCVGRIANPSGRSRRCDAPLCDAHATPVDATRYLCPSCHRAAAPPAAREGSLVAYTDGSGTIASLPCGAGVVLFEGASVILEASKYLGLGTNNRAELCAAGLALAMTDGPTLRGRPLLVRTDSMYVIGSATGEAPHPLATNAKIIQALRDRMVGREVRFEHVKGHSGVWGNERADELAGMARKQTWGGAR